MERSQSNFKTSAMVLLITPVTGALRAKTGLMSWLRRQGLTETHKMENFLWGSRRSKIAFKRFRSIMMRVKCTRHTSCAQTMTALVRDKVDLSGAGRAVPATNSRSFQKQTRQYGQQLILGTKLLCLNHADWLVLCIALKYHGTRCKESAMEPLNSNLTASKQMKQS